LSLPTALSTVGDVILIRVPSWLAHDEHQAISGVTLAETPVALRGLQ